MTLDEQIDDLVDYMNEKGVPLMRYDEVIATPSAIQRLETDLAACEGLTLLQQQKGVLESNLSDLHNRTMRDDLAKLKIRGEKLKERLRKAKEVDKRRKDLEKKRDGQK